MTEAAPAPDRPETEQGRALFRELLWVHRMIRRDLETVRRLAAEVPGGLPAEELRAEIAELEANRPLWKLKANCLQYCRFVHSHHNAEDVAFFPALRRSEPEVGSVVDRLEAEHVQVGELLTVVEHAAAALGEDDGEDSRRRVANSLNGLSELLLAHLDYEEENIGPTIRRLRSF